MKVTASTVKPIIEIALDNVANSVAYTLHATYFYTDGTQATCRRLDGPFSDRESAAHYASLYHHIHPTEKQLGKSVWSGKPRYPLVAGPKGQMVAKIVVQVLEMDVCFVFYSYFEPKRLQQLANASDNGSVST